MPGTSCTVLAPTVPAWIVVKTPVQPFRPVIVPLMIPDEGRPMARARSPHVTKLVWNGTEMRYRTPPTGKAIESAVSHPVISKLDGALTLTWNPSPGLTQKQDEAEQPGSEAVVVPEPGVQVRLTQSYVHSPGIPEPPPTSAGDL